MDQDPSYFLKVIETVAKVMAITLVLAAAVIGTLVVLAVVL